MVSWHWKPLKNCWDIPDCFILHLRKQARGLSCMERFCNLAYGDAVQNSLEALQTIVRTQYGGEGQGIWYLHPLQYLHCSAVLCYVCHPPWLVKDKHHIAMVLCHVPNVCLQFWSGELDDRKISWGTIHNPQRPVSTICKCLQVAEFFCTADSSSYCLSFNIFPAVDIPLFLFIKERVQNHYNDGLLLGIKCYILVFSCPQQLNRWPCHSLTQSVTQGTFTFDITEWP